MAEKYDEKGMSGEPMDDEDASITLTLEDGSEMECAVLAIFPAGGYQYIALVPQDQIDAEDSDVYLYRFEEFEDGEIQLDNIEDDDEFDIASDAFDELLDNQEFDELFGDYSE